MTLRFGSASDATLSRDRETLLKALIAEEGRSRPSEIKGRPMLSTAVANPEGTPGFRRMRADTAYDLRAVLCSEVVFDLDDKRPGRPGDFPLSLREDFRDLCLTLVEERIPFLAALSAGSGVHVGVTLADHIGVTGEDHRRAFVSAIKTLIQERRGNESSVSLDWATPPEAAFDPVTLFPAYQARLIREFGARKRPDSPYRKVLWADSEYRALPELRADAYKQARLVIPTRLPVLRGGVGVVHEQVREALGGRCPKTSECYRNFPCDGCAVSA